jgi:hypothetical protein
MLSYSDWETWSSERLLAAKPEEIRKITQREVPMIKISDNGQDLAVLISWKQYLEMAALIEKASAALLI